MSNENVKKFYEELAKNEELQKELIRVMEDCKTKNMSEEDTIREIRIKVIELATEKGYEIDLAEMEEYEKTLENGMKLSEKELEETTGGNECFCIAGGGGKKGNGHKYRCGCVLYGEGKSNRSGEYRLICHGFGNDPDPDTYI